MTHDPINVAAKAIYEQCRSEGCATEEFIGYLIRKSLEDCPFNNAIDNGHFANLKQMVTPEAFGVPERDRRAIQWALDMITVLGRRVTQWSTHHDEVMESIEAKCDQLAMDVRRFRK